MKFTKKALEKILEDHQIWLGDQIKGARAFLRETDLRGADLAYWDLQYADLSGANLRGANL